MPKGTFEAGEEAARRLYNRGYIWMGLKQYLESHRIHETQEFVEGFEYFLHSILIHKE